jgi:DNA (cytosine-5)-methyltransferase 1
MTLVQSILREQSTRYLYNHVASGLSELDLEMVRSIPPGGNWSNIPSEVAAKSTRVMKIRATGGRTTYYGRLRPDKPSYTINTYFNRPGNGTFIHPEQDRLISFREAARLQSFPDDFRFFGSNASMYKQIGNAVPPLLAQAIGRTIKCGSVVDLFSGAGGLSKGLSDAGHRVILAAEKKEHMRTTYATNHPNTTVLDVDLRKPEHIELVIGEVDRILRGRTLGILAGGPPCQGFSTAGNWSFTDPRNSLVFSMLRLVKYLQPESVLIENVVGLRIQKRGAMLDAILSCLSDMGYASEWYQLNAERYGVPQRRKRVFIVACRSEDMKGPPSPLFLETHRVSNTPATDGLKPVTVADAISDLPPLEPGGGSHESPYNASWAHTPYQKLMRGLITFGQFIRRQSGQG